MKSILWQVCGALALLLTCVACGGGGDDGGGKAAGDADAQVGASTSPQLQYAQCMRDNGVSIPDPVEGQPGSLFEGIDMKAPAFVAADKVCGHFLDSLAQEREDNSAQDPNQDAEMLQLASCLRDHGINVKDPVPGQGFGADLDRSDPNVAKVLQACQKK